MKVFVIAALFAVTTNALLYANQPQVQLPLKTKGRQIVDQQGMHVKLACINWVSHLEPLIPEGLSELPIERWAAFIKDSKFNCVRYTMSDEQIANFDMPVQERHQFISPTSLLRMRQHNPQLLSNLESQRNVTVYDVFLAAMSALNSQGIFVILDNHVSKAMWCCGFTDYNRWWAKKSEVAFNPWTKQSANSFQARYWIRALGRMSRESLKWPNIVGVGLRNEPHSFRVGSGPRHDWYKYMRLAAEEVHAENSDALVIVGGMESSSNFKPLKREALFPRNHTIAHRIVYEFHFYNLAYVKPFWDVFGTKLTCKYMTWFLDSRVGFLIKNPQADYYGPIWLSEFGMDVERYSSKTLGSKDARWFECLSNYIVERDLDFGYWQLTGTYYWRDNKFDYHESWSVTQSVPHGKPLFKPYFMNKLQVLSGSN